MEEFLIFPMPGKSLWKMNKLLLIKKYKNNKKAINTYNDLLRYHFGEDIPKTNIDLMNILNSIKE